MFIIPCPNMDASAPTPLEENLIEFYYYADRKLDTAFVLLEELKDKIDFNSKDEKQLDYLLLEAYLLVQRKRYEEVDSLISNIDIEDFSYSKKQKLNYQYYKTFRKSNDLDLLKEFGEEVANSKDEILQLGYKFTLAAVLREQGHTKESLSVFEEILTLANKSNDYLQKANALYHLGGYHFRTANYETGIEFLLQAIEQYELADANYGLASTYNSLGVIFRNKGMYNEALKFFQESLHNSKSINNSTLTGYTTNNIGLLYKQKGDYKNALESYLSSKSYLKDGGDIRPISYINNNIGDLYLKIGNFEKAEQFLLESIRQKKEIPDRMSMISTYSKLGILYTEQNQYVRAEENFSKAITISDQMASYVYVGEAFMGMGNLAVIQSDQSKAKKYFLKALEISEKNNDFDDQYKALELLSQLSSQENSYKQSLDYLKKSIAVKDSILSFQKIKELEQLTFEYENRNKVLEQELQLEKLKSENLKKDAIILSGKQKSLIYLFLLFAAIMTLLMGFRNIAQKRKTNEELSSMNMLLEDKNEKLKINQEKLEDNNINLRNFSGMAAHDLKSPLKTISSFTALIRRKYKDKIEEKDMSMFNLIGDSTSTLTKMIDDLLSFSRIDQELPPAQEINLDNLVGSVVKMLSATIYEKEAVIQFNNLHSIQGHESMVKVLFQNILQNSLKFTKEGTHPHIIISSEKTHNGKIKVCISDNGIGIDAKYQKEVFGGFKKLHASSKYEGTGIGLATCKRICQYYGGNIWIESELGKGTDMIFELNPSQSV